jgi:hypothetical protein
MIAIYARAALAVALVAAACATYAQEGPSDATPGGRAATAPRGDASRLLTRQERREHHDKMMAAKSVEQCRALQAEQQKLLEQRAKDKGVQLPTPRRGAQDMCERMQARGRFKATS